MQDARRIAKVRIMVAVPGLRKADGSPVLVEYRPNGNYDMRMIVTRYWR
jgi:hypothetical protein